eukprot:TRINITY_DN10124_c0_g1_i1.p1 TRINITY_DN10124_c0_g1~~TRINITY_DN10124_c0_g1_i1.p1  ORF type:complete len:307 (+),score=87.98 TRINITY_DN10124_c0_g1_i1:80-922(+)
MNALYEQQQIEQKQEETQNAVESEDNQNVENVENEESLNEDKVIEEVENEEKDQEEVVEEEEEEQEKQDKISILKIPDNFISREVDKLQYVDVLSNLLSNYWKSKSILYKAMSNKQKSKRITFSTKNLKIGYAASKLVALLHDTNSKSMTEDNVENVDKISDIQCNFSIHQYRSVGSIRYRPFELMIGYYLLSFGDIVHSLGYSQTFTLKNHDLLHFFIQQVVENVDPNFSLPAQQSLIIEYDKQILGYTPFHIEPAKSVKITPKSSFDFVVSYKSKRKR